MAKKIKITQTRSVIGRIKAQKDTIRALGLKKRGRSVVHDDTPAIRGMASSVSHLVTIEEVSGKNAEA
ncbi:MAG: 50S ribosomal protein L30 [Chitinivibrionales bacterium]|nr:50S ribosomal protein L30 [Chitinivibrionales bacterium]MBD3397223.1 50S ribosomal protein L30 [Chitinivibrionales bacterium]